MFFQFLGFRYPFDHNSIQVYSSIRASFCKTQNNHPAHADRLLIQDFELLLGFSLCIGARLLPESAGTIELRSKQVLYTLCGNLHCSINFSLICSRLHHIRMRNTGMGDKGGFEAHGNHVVVARTNGRRTSMRPCHQARQRRLHITKWNQVDSSSTPQPLLKYSLLH